MSLPSRQQLREVSRGAWRRSSEQEGMGCLWIPESPLLRGLGRGPRDLHPNCLVRLLQAARGREREELSNHWAEQLGL